VSPYRIAAPKSPPPLVAPERREDAFGYLFWFVVAVLGLAVASGGGSAAGPPSAQERAK
jgi:hypothetical protein